MNIMGERTKAKPRCRGKDDTDMVLVWLGALTRGGFCEGGDELLGELSKCNH
jgi:hypothetical protein